MGKLIHGGPHSRECEELLKTIFEFDIAMWQGALKGGYKGTFPAHTAMLKTERAFIEECAQIGEFPQEVREGLLLIMSCAQEGLAHTFCLGPTRVIHVDKEAEARFAEVYDKLQKEQDSVPSCGEDFVVRDGILRAACEYEQKLIDLCEEYKEIPGRVRYYFTGLP
jgi:hypothetical protein